MTKDSPLAIATFSIVGGLFLGAGLAIGAIHFKLLPQPAAALPVTAKSVPTQPVSSMCLEEIRQLRKAVDLYAEKVDRANAKAAVVK